MVLEKALLQRGAQLNVEGTDCHLLVGESSLALHRLPLCYLLRYCSFKFKLDVLLVSCRFGVCVLVPWCGLGCAVIVFLIVNAL